MRLLGRDVDVLDLGVALERVHPELPAEPGLLEPAEGRRDPDGRIRVDGEDARVHRSGDPHRPTDVAGPDRPRQPVRRVVRDPDGVGLVLEGDHGGDRAEHLLPRDAVVVRCLHERAGKPEARTVGCVATKGNGTVRIGRHLLAVRGGDQRAHLGRVVVGIADSNRGRPVDEQLEEPVVCAPLDEDAGPGAAVLAGVAEDRRRSAGRGRLQIGIREHQVRGLAAELQRDPLDRRRRALP